MTIDTFAQKHRLKTHVDDCGEKIVPRKKGESHIFEYDSARLGVMYMQDPAGQRAPTTRKWNALRDELVAAGCQITQDADGEGSAIFDPADPNQVKVALKVAGARPRKQASSAQLASLAAGRAVLDPGKQALSAA